MPLYPAPAESRLSNQLAGVSGVIFSSESLPISPRDAWSGNSFVAVARFMEPSATGSTNGIVSVNAYGAWIYYLPIRIEFVLPSDPLVPAVTDFFSVGFEALVDGQPQASRLDAFDINGNLLASESAPGGQAGLLSVRHPGIHSVRITPDGGNLFNVIDGVTFNAPVAPLRVALEFAPRRVRWNSRLDWRYQVQYSSTLAPDSWVDLGGTITGNGTTNVVNDPTLGLAWRFYRVQELP